MMGNRSRPVARWRVEIHNKTSEVCEGVDRTKTGKKIEWYDVEHFGRSLSNLHALTNQGSLYDNEGGRRARGAIQR
jgi:hypothetical protein